MSYLSIDEIIKQLAETNPNVSEEEGLKEKLREDFEELEQNYKLKDDSKTIKEKLHSFKEKHSNTAASLLVTAGILGSVMGPMMALHYRKQLEDRIDLEDVVERKEAKVVYPEYDYYGMTEHMRKQDANIRRLRDKNYLGTSISTIDIKNALSDYAKTQEWD